MIYSAPFEHIYLYFYHPASPPPFPAGSGNGGVLANFSPEVPSGAIFVGAGEICRGVRARGVNQAPQALWYAPKQPERPAEEKTQGEKLLTFTLSAIGATLIVDWLKRL